MWGLPWGLLCGTICRKNLCMVPCHSCHIASHKRGALFIGKAGSHYCETLLQVLLGIYCKRIYWIPLFTRLRLLYVFEIGKAKSATQSVLMMILYTSERASPEKFSSFLLYPWKFHILNPPPFPICFLFHYSVCTIISDCNHPFDTNTFLPIKSHKNIYIIAIENAYLDGVFLKSKISIFQ